MRLKQAWLSAALAFSFAAFSLGSCLLAWTVIPVCRWSPGSPTAKDLRVQRCVHWSFRGFIVMWDVLGLTRVSWRGAERLRSIGPCVIAPNHPTLIDVVMLMAALPQADCVVKHALWDNRFLGGVVRGAGYIRSDAHDVLLPACVERLAAGRTMILFPEGTRSPPGTLGRFNRGAAHVSLISGRPLVPVAITSEVRGLGKDDAWYNAMKRRMQITVSVLEPIVPDPQGAEPGLRSLAARDLSQTLFSRIEAELECARSET